MSSLEWSGKERTLHVKLQCQRETKSALIACFEQVGGWSGIEHSARLSGQTTGLGRFIRLLIHGEFTSEDFDVEAEPPEDLSEKTPSEIRPREPGATTSYAEVSAVLTRDELGTLQDEYDDTPSPWDQAWRLRREDQIPLRRFLDAFATEVAE